VAPRKWVQLSGLGPVHELCVHNQTIDVLARAVLERVLMCELKTGEVVPPLGSTTEEWSEMDEFCTRLDKFNGRHWFPQTAVQVVGYYTGAKREMYEKARLDLVREPGLLTKDSMTVAFGKFEKGKLNKPPRVIQPRPARYNLQVGKYLKQIEKRIYRSIAKLYQQQFGGVSPVIMKGYDVAKTAQILHHKWDRFARPAAIGIDAVKFDMHVSIPALQMEHGVYERMYRNDPKLKRLLSKQLHNKGRGYCDDGDLKYSVDGARLSGDMNTSLGNCVLMGACVWTYAKRVGVTIELANNGDDCVIFCEEEDVGRFREGLEAWFATKGFRMEVEPTVYDFEAVEFCQSHPVWNGEHYVMCRSLPNVLVKDAMCLVPLVRAIDFRYWLAAVGMCGGSLSTGVPVMQSFYAAYRRNGGRAIPTRGFIANMYGNSGQFERMGALSYGVREIEARARFSFWIATGITPCVQICMEEYYDSYAVSWSENMREVSAVQIKDTNYTEYPQEDHI